MSDRESLCEQSGDRQVIKYAELRMFAAECADAAEAWDNSLSSWCDGPERDALRTTVVQLRRAINTGVDDDA